MAVAATACSGPSGSGAADRLDQTDLPATVGVTSGAFPTDGAIPTRYTCDGEDVSPPLAWSGTDDAAEVALVVDDPDAPRGTYVHWVVTGLDPAVTSLEEGSLPPGAKVAKSSAGEAAYEGPCPPRGKTHHYRFTVYALAKPLALEEGGSTSDALDAIREAASAKGRLTGIFER